MGNVSVPAVFFVLVASLAISVASARSRKSDRLTEFLFAGNTPLLGLSSCIGSIISMAVTFTALLSAGYEWGWQMIFPLIAGCGAGITAVLALTRHPRIVEQWPADKRAYVRGVSYLAVLGSRSTMPYYAFSIAAYGAMLVTELVVLRGFLASLTQLPGAELLLTLLTIFGVCYAYVFVGGFRGVLVTDYFQLMVVFVFVGLWLASMFQHTRIQIPSPFASHAGFTGWTRLLLFIGVFGGAFSWVFASLDQWYRTVGTLDLRPARGVLTSAAVALCACSIAPVMAGAAAIGRPNIPPAISNGVSLILIADLLAHANTTVHFVFAMALTCAALTTLNTYLMTLQQLYYEAETRIGAGDNRFLFLWLKFPLKWKQVRAVMACLAALAFAASCFFPPRYVYAFGVLALSTIILMVPFLAGALAEVFEASRKRVIAAVARFLGDALMTHGGTGLAGSLTGWVVLLIGARSSLGSLSRHLYVIPAAAVGGVAIGIATVLLFRTVMRAMRKESPR